jgi:DNA-binding GntR family transcriptional regulator
MDALEHDLHVACLSRCANQDLLDSLQRTRCLLTMSKHVLGVSAPMPQADPFMADHLAVFEAMAAGDAETATSHLRQHLEVSCLKVIERAERVRADYPKPRLPYIG